MACRGWYLAQLRAVVVPPFTEEGGAHVMLKW